MRDGEEAGMPGAPVIYFGEVDEEQQSSTPRVRPLVGVRLIEVQLASQMSAIVPENEAHLLLLRRWMADLYGFGPLPLAEDISDAAIHQDINGIGRVVKSFVIRGVTGKLIQLVSMGTSTLSAFLRRQWGRRRLEAFEQGTGRQFNDLTRSEIIDALTAEAGKRSGLCSRIIEDVGERCMGRIVFREGLRRARNSLGQRFSKRYTGFNDLAEDPATGKWYVLEAKGGESRLAKMDITDQLNGQTIKAEQMDRFWLRKKVDELLAGDLAEVQFGFGLLAKWDAGRLLGRLYHTDVLDATPKPTRMVEIDYGTMPPW